MFLKTHQFILLFILTFLSVSLYSQSEELVKKDSNTYHDVIRTVGESTLQCDSNGVVEDTLYLDLYQYDPLFTSNYLYATMGNIGRPHRPLFLSTPSIEFTYRIFPLEAYEYNFSKLNIYNVKSPYTKLFYATGTGKENFLSGVHAQKINNISFGVDFRIITALGLYRHSKSNNTGGSTYFGYDHSNKKYGLLAAFTFNRLRPQENGGILYDSIFEQNIEPVRAGVNTRLSQAENKLKTHTLNFSQYYNPFFNPKDSANSFNYGTFIHIFSYERSDHVFTEFEPDSANYTFFLRDTLNTYDSTSYLKARNGFYWMNYSLHNQPKKESYWFFKIGIVHEYAEISDYIQTNYISQFVPEGEISYKLKRAHEFGIKGSYISTGYSKDGFQGVLWTKIKPFKSLSHYVNISTSVTSKMPDYFYSYYHGNNYQWDNNNLAKMLQTQTSVDYITKNIEVGTSNFTINNQVFIDKRYQPLQFDKTLYYFQAYAKAKLKFRAFNSITNITTTQGNNDTLMAFPKFTARQSLFFRFPLFEKRMQLQTGVDFIYLSNYYAPNYVPAIGEFVIQNNKQYGNFLYLNFFIGFKVKQFNAMLKVQNVAKGLLGYNYMMMPQYPMPDRLFKLVISWRFYD